MSIPYNQTSQNGNTSDSLKRPIRAVSAMWALNSVSD